MKMKLEGPVVFIGASSVYGRCDTEEGGFVHRFRMWLESQQLKNTKVYNLGISGNNTNDYLERMSEEIIPRNPRLIIWSLGSNDCKRVEDKNNPPDIFEDLYKKNIKKIIEKSLEIADTIFIGVYPIDDSKTTPIQGKDIYYLLYEVIKYENIAKEICKENEIPYLDIMSKWLKIDYNSYLAEDGLHANAKGHAEIYKELRIFLKNL
ncbi:hypothetical protein GF362_06500 [Candidatus Dojkabacteria bacterium]|nr:hypothetical protein [Candidatus Dojkabacteria bacterium]